MLKKVVIMVVRMIKLKLREVVPNKVFQMKGQRNNMF